MIQDFWLSRGPGVRTGKEWEFGVSRCKPLYIGWVNKVLLKSTGKYSQEAGVNHHGKDYEKKVCRTESLC